MIETQNPELETRQFYIDKIPDLLGEILNRRKSGFELATIHYPIPIGDPDNLWIYEIYSNRNIILFGAPKEDKTAIKDG